MKEKKKVKHLFLQEIFYDLSSSDLLSKFCCHSLGTIGRKLMINVKNGKNGFDRDFQISFIGLGRSNTK